jgi:cytochrome c-type biogenesis protein CcmE
MTPKLLKILVSVVVIGGGLAYLMGASMADNLEYYKKVDEVAAEKERWEGVRMRMGGHVKEGTIFNKTGTLEYVFTVEHEGAELPVHYTGVVPDTFTENVEVVVTGRLKPEGHFEASHVFAKCPSKYEGQEPTGDYDAFGQRISDAGRPGHPDVAPGTPRPDNHPPAQAFPFQGDSAGY